MKLTGYKGVIQEIKKYQKLYPDAVATALYQEGLKIDRKSQRLVPVDTSRLKNTHYVTEPDNSKNPRIEVGYGTNYAIYVHEMVEIPHKVGQAKYLQTVFESVRPDFARDILNLTRKNVLTGRRLSSLMGSAPNKPKEE